MNEFANIAGLIFCVLNVLYVAWFLAHMKNHDEKIKKECLKAELKKMFMAFPGPDYKNLRDHLKEELKKQGIDADGLD